MDLRETLPPPIDGAPLLTPVRPPPGSPDDPATRRAGGTERTAEGKLPPGPVSADLVFVNGQVRETTVPVSHPFIVDGVRYDAIRVRRLTTGEVSQLLGQLGTKGMPDPFEVYAVMTGLSAAVLRGIDAQDGMEVAEVASNFLPPSLRTAYGLT